MSYKVGQRVTFNGHKAVVTSDTPSGYDVASATEATGGKCRAMHLNVNAETLSEGWPEEEE